MSNRYWPQHSVRLNMKWVRYLAMVAAALAGNAQADETNPNAHTPITEWVYQGAAFADMLTTLDIKNHPNLVETNPLLGQHPSDARVLGYFAATGTLHYLFTRELVRENVPAPIVQTWEALGISLEVGMVAHNYSIGLRIGF